MLHTLVIRRMSKQGLHSVEEYFGCNINDDAIVKPPSNRINCEDRVTSCSSTSGRKLRHSLWASDDYQLARDLVIANANKDSSSGKRNTGSLKNTGAGTGRPTIPKIIHFIWVGPRPIPRYQDLLDRSIDSGHQDQSQGNETINSWRIHHPEWEIKIWRDKDIHILQQQQHYNASSCSAKLNALYQHAIDQKQYGMASDIARLQILYAHGGLYVDIDYLCVRSVEDLHKEDHIDFYCGASNTGCIEFNNGLIGSIPSHFFVKRVMERIADWWEVHFAGERERESDNSIMAENKLLEYSNEIETTPVMSLLSSFLDSDSAQHISILQKENLPGKPIRFTPMEVIEHTGPGVLTRELLNLFRGNGDSKDDASLIERIAIMPWHTFNPLPNTYRRLGLHLQTTTKDTKEEIKVDEILKKYIVPGKTRAVHLWSCSWQ